MSDKTRDCVARPTKVKLGQLYTLGELERLGLVTLGRGKVISKIDIANTPGNNPVYSSSAMGNGEIGRYGKYMFEDERITWSVDGGGRLFYREPHKYSVTNVCGWLKVNAPDIDTKFLYLLLTSRWGRMTFDYTYKAHPSVIKEAYRDLSFPSLSDQHRLTAKIDQIVALIKVRELQLSKFDELVKSRFVEMFGDETEQDRWPNDTVGDVAEVCVGVVIKPTQYYRDSGVRAFRSLNIGTMFVKDSDWVYFSAEGHAKNQKSVVRKGDVLVVRSGAPGTACVVPAIYDDSNAVDIIIAHPNVDKVDPIFLAMFTNMPHGMNQIRSRTGGAAQQHYNVGGYKELRLSIPPLSLQHEFAAFVAEVDKSEFAVRKSLEELQKLYRQQLQEAFG